MSARSCRGRSLLLWFAGERPAVTALMRAAVFGDGVEGEADFRPRDRKIRPVRFRVRLVADADGQSLRWAFSSEGL